MPTHPRYFMLQPCVHVNATICVLSECKCVRVVHVHSVQNGKEKKTTVARLVSDF